MKIKNKSLYNILITLLVYDKNGKEVGGLLTESLTLGTKRKIQKIRKEVLKAYQDYEADVKEVEKVEDAEKRKSEMTALNEEDVTLVAEPFERSQLDDLKTEINYDFDTLDLISK